MILDCLRPGYILMKLQRFREERKGVDFLSYMSQEDAGTDASVANHYAMSHMPVVRKMFKTIEQEKMGGFVDFGCGKGMILAEAAKYPFSCIAGVELSDRIAQIAKNNMEVLGLNRVQIICADAQEVKELDEYNYFYFYNPFPERVFENVIRNIVDSYHRSPRHMMILYYNPVYANIVEGADEFRKSGEIQMRIGLRRKKSFPCYIYENEHAQYIEKRE